MYLVPKFHSNTWMQLTRRCLRLFTPLSVNVTFHGESINVFDFLAILTAPREQQEFMLYAPRCFVKSQEVWYLK